MSQSRVNLATARRELAERQDEVNLFTAELKAAQELMAAGGTGPKTLTVTVKEIFGAIAVDRVAVRPPNAPAQEKVIAEAIPCKFTIDAGTDKFDLVLMVEHAATSNGQAAAAAAAASAGSTPAADGETAVSDETDEVVISAGGAAEAVEADKASATELPETPPAEQAEAVGEEGVGPAATAADAAAAATAATGAEADETAAAEEPLEPAAVATAAAGAEADEITELPADGDVPSAGEAEVGGDEQAATGGEEGAAPVEAAVEGGGEAVAPEGSDGGEGGGGATASDVAGADEAEVSLVAAEVEAPVVVDEGGDETSAGAAASGADEGGAAGGTGYSDASDAAAEAAAATAAATAAMTEMTAEAVAEAALLETANRDIATPAAAATAMGCSTATTEVVVPSSELNLKSSHGQWRYLEADSTPVHGDDAVEVTKGVRFSTTLESLDRREDENRVVDLAIKLDEAEQRVRSAEAMIKKLQPAPAGGGAGTSSRKKSGGGAGGRKSALKKGKGAGGTRAVKSDARKTKRAVSMVSSAVGTVCGKALTAGAFVWDARNLVFFVSAVAAMHLHGDYLAV
ncbi:unnamed protein product [Laminaria digitata]